MELKSIFCHDDDDDVGYLFLNPKSSKCSMCSRFFISPLSVVWKGQLSVICGEYFCVVLCRTSFSLPGFRKWCFAEWDKEWICLLLHGNLQLNWKLLVFDWKLIKENIAYSNDQKKPELKQRGKLCISLYSELLKRLLKYSMKLKGDKSCYPDNC